MYGGRQNGKKKERERAIESTTQCVFYAQAIIFDSFNCKIMIILIIQWLKSMRSVNFRGIQL